MPSSALPKADANLQENKITEEKTTVPKVKPTRRKRRTKAEMEAARALEAEKKITSVKQDAVLIPATAEKPTSETSHTIKETKPLTLKKKESIKKVETAPQESISTEKNDTNTEKTKKPHHKRGRKPRNDIKTDKNNQQVTTHQTTEKNDTNTTEEQETTSDNTQTEKKHRPQQQRNKRNNNRRRKNEDHTATSDEAKGEQMHLREVAAMHPKSILDLAESVNIENASSMRKAEQVFAILKAHASRGGTLYSEGVLEVLPDGFGFLRSPEANYMAGPDDVYVSNHQIRRFSLRKGDTIAGEIRSPRSNERYFALKAIDTINDHDPRDTKTKVLFDNLTPLYPDEGFRMEVQGSKDLTGRVIDLVAPIGKGQRGLLVAPPRTGKTVMMQSIAHSIEANHPDATLMVLLIDERPEEVTDMKRSVKGEVVASTFDEPAQHHVQVAEMVIEKAKRLVEHGKDVIVLLDSITRLARAYNTVSPSSGKILSGGVDSNALHRPKRFFGAARNIEGGGSLTIIATALVDTGSRMDEVIFEEFKGTGNMEIHLSRKLMDKRIFPAIDMAPSGTRKEELLLEQTDMAKVWVLRRILSPMGTADSMEFLLEKLRQHPTNADFFLGMNQ